MMKSLKYLCYILNNNLRLDLEKCSIKKDPLTNICFRSEIMNPKIIEF